MATGARGSHAGRGLARLGVAVAALAAASAGPFTPHAAGQPMSQDACRERFSVYTSELVWKAEIKVMKSFDAYKAKIQDLAIKSARFETGFAGANKTDLAAQATADRQFLQAQLDAMPHMNQRINEGGSSGFYPIYLCQVQDYVGRPRFRAEVDRMREIEERHKGWTTQLASLEAGGVSTAGSVSIEQYSVFRANRDVLVGQIDALGDIPACRLKGWGVDCTKKVGELTRLVNVAPNFDTFEAARSFYCQALRKETIKVVPLTGGRDRTAQFSFSSEPLNIQNAPSCP